MLLLKHYVGVWICFIISILNSFLLLNDVMLHFRWKVPGVMDGDEPRSFVTLYEFEGYIYMPFFVWHFFFFQLLFFVNCLDWWAVYYSTWYVFLINTFFWHNFIRLEAKLIKQIKHNEFSDCFLGFQRFSKSLTIIQRIYCQVC